MKKDFFISDFKRIQNISGLVAAISILATVLFSIFMPISHSIQVRIWCISACGMLFAILYYLFPKIYLSRKLVLLPDFIYVILISLVMKEVPQFGYFYLTFILILLAIDAFMFSLTEFVAAVIFTLLGVLWANLDGNTLSVGAIFQMFGILVMSLTMRLIADEGLTIKEKKEALEVDINQLETDKREIKTLLESIGDGMFVINAQGKITFYNKTALGILGIIAPKERILGRDVNDFLSTIGKNGPENITREVFGNYKHSIRNDFRIVKNDKVIKLHTNITPVIAEKGKLQGAIIFFRDITNEKRVEEEKAEFNAIASHEIRSPLSVIEGYLYYLLDPSSKLKYDKETKGCLEKAHEASKDLIHLVTDILTVVKAEEKNLEVNLEKVDIAAIVKKVTEEQKKAAENKKLNLSYALVTTRHIPDLITDPIKVREVLSNYISNAIKFSARGEIKVELGLLANEVIVSVIDRGVGIGEDDLKMIFQKFYRAENWKTRKTGGTGLGLFISKTLVERLGGRVGVQSKLNQGSKFYFTLPLKYPNEEDLGKIKNKLVSKRRKDLLYCGSDREGK